MPELLQAAFKNWIAFSNRNVSFSNSRNQTPKVKKDHEICEALGRTPSCAF